MLCLIDDILVFGTNKEEDDSNSSTKEIKMSHSVWLSASSISPVCNSLVISLTKILTQE